MLNYIMDILGKAPNTGLNNMLYNMLNNSTFRKNITYNHNTDKFEIPCSKISPKLKSLLQLNGFAYTEKVLDETNICIEMWYNTISFWLK